MTEGKVKTGRLARLAKLATLSARVSSDVMSRGVKRLRGSEVESLLGHATAEKLVATLGDLKGLAMKLGQSMSMDPDLLSPEVRAVVARLQNQAPPMPYAVVQSVVEEGLGASPDVRFAQFEPQPMAAASLGQVHRAVTHDGVEVAVKVQYPDIADALAADVDNVGAMVRVFSATSGMAHGREYFEEVREGLLDELDYTHEAQRAQAFAEATAPFSQLTVPRVFTSLSSARVLTMEFVHGQTLKELLTQPLSAAQRFEVARLHLHAVWGPFLRTGLIHCDPHPGNFVLQADGRMAVLDFGAIKQVSERWLGVNRRLLHSAVRDGPFDGVAESVGSGFVIEEPEVARPLVESIIAIATRPARSTDFDYGQAGIHRDMRGLFLKHAFELKGVRPPREAIQFFRAVGGASQNLENLKARGDFRSCYRELEAFV